MEEGLERDAPPLLKGEVRAFKSEEKEEKLLGKGEKTLGERASSLREVKGEVRIAELTRREGECAKEEKL